MVATKKEDGKRARVLALLAELADVLLADDARPDAPSAELYYSDDANPIATGDRKARLRWRAWLKSRGVSHFKAGRKTLALRADVDAAIQAKPLRAHRDIKPANDGASDRDLLAGAGVRLRSTR